MPICDKCLFNTGILKAIKDLLKIIIIPECLNKGNWCYADAHAFNVPKFINRLSQPYQRKKLVRFFFKLEVFTQETEELIKTEKQLILYMPECEES